MLNQHNRSVNVSRKELLTALIANLAAHRKDYLEAVADYRVKVLHDLKKKTKEATKATDEQLLRMSHLYFNPPQNHEQEYLDMIEMFEMSVDENINLDHASFKAYFKNEWPWSQQFAATAMAYKSL